MTGMITALVGSIIEAWAEVRVNRTRVLLSLVGVAVAVAAVTGVIAVGNIAQQGATETSERTSGRPATLYLTMFMADGSAPPEETASRVWSEALARYDVTYASAVSRTQTNVQFADGVSEVDTQLVDQPYAVMHRTTLDEGTWFTARDADAAAPSIVVNEAFYDRLGRPDLARHPTVALAGANPVTAVIVGVVPTDSFDTASSMYMLNDSYSRAKELLQPDGGQQVTPQFELWVPPALAADLTTRLQTEISSELGEGGSAQVYRQDYAASGEDPFLSIKLLISGVGALVLLLGALSLVNISLVTVRQRIQEIGIRRSFGATGARVFFAVMMESVVATVAAGVIGVMVAILVVSSPMLVQTVAPGIIDVPPFPLDVALLGLAAATIVGGLAGILPALIAVRVRVIDAIRYT